MIQDEVHISDLEVSCIVGILPHERHTKQPVIVNATIAMDLTTAAVQNDLAFSVDYALLSQQIQFILETAQFELLETAALAVASWIAAPRGDQSCKVASADVRIRKPNALGGNGIASVRIKRFDESIKIEPVGGQDFVFRSKRVAILRVRPQVTTNPPGFANFKDFPNNDPIGLRVAWV